MNRLKMKRLHFLTLWEFHQGPWIGCTSCLNAQLQTNSSQFQGFGLPDFPKFQALHQIPRNERELVNGICLPFVSCSPKLMGRVRMREVSSVYSSA